MRNLWSKELLFSFELVKKFFKMKIIFIWKLNFSNWVSFAYVTMIWIFPFKAIDSLFIQNSSENKLTIFLNLAYFCLLIWFLISNCDYLAFHIFQFLNNEILCFWSFLGCSFLSIYIFLDCVKSLFRNLRSLLK